MIDLASGQFPAYKKQVKELVEQHLELKDEPLLLALYYAPRRDPDHLFVFEVVSNFGGGKVDADRELFEVTFASTSGLPLADKQRLHLVLTNPAEIEVALREHWPLAEEVREAVKQGRSETIYFAPKVGKKLLRAIGS